MREIVVKPTNKNEERQRLVALLATGLERLLTSQRVVDFTAGESVTTTCPEAGRKEPT
jgi:hypothetical protein